MLGEILRAVSLLHVIKVINTRRNGRFNGFHVHNNAYIAPFCKVPVRYSTAVSTDTFNPRIIFS
jgi:hypothetical protein